MSSSLSGKTVVITGASRGIGLGIAKGFAAAGAQLTLIANDEAVASVAAGIGAAGAVADITDPAAVDRALAGLLHIDVLITRNARISKNHQAL